MQYSKSISLKCPHCKSICQFTTNDHISYCKQDNLFHVFYVCSNCGWLVLVKFNYDWSNPTRIDAFKTNTVYTSMNSYYPIIWTWDPKTKIEYITNSDVKKDYEEAINCYNNWFYNACMVMTRRAIHQLMIEEWLEAKFPNNLYQQIENSWIGDNLKKLLQKVKNFGNSWAHPDFCLYDEEENKIEDTELFARLSLEFLDKFFSDKYEIDTLVAQAPKSAKE